MIRKYAVTTIVAASIFLSSCSNIDSFKSREFPLAPSGYSVQPTADVPEGRPHETIVEVLNDITKLQDKYQELNRIYDADTNNFSLFYLATATATAAAAIFKSHPDVLKGLALAAGVGVGAETIISPQQKRDALELAITKLGCVHTASLILVVDKDDDFTRSSTTIVSASRQIHFNLLKEFKGARIDYSAQANALVAAAGVVTEIKKRDNDAARAEAHAAILACVI